MAGDASTQLVAARPGAVLGRRFQLLVALTGLVVAAYVVATLVGASEGALDLAFTVAVVTLPPFAWWAFARAPAELRSFLFLLGLAASFWLAGSLIWYGYFLANGQKVPSPPGLWDAAFLIAYALALGAVYVGFRRVISLRLVALDSSVLAAAALAFGAALVGHGLAKGISAASVVPILRPLLGIVMIALLASAALHRWEGLPVPVALVGTGQVFLTIGSFVYAFEAVQSDYINDRWADLGWFAGAIVSLLAASTVVLGINEPVRQLGEASRDPERACRCQRGALARRRRACGHARSRARREAERERAGLDRRAGVRRLGRPGDGRPRADRDPGSSSAPTNASTAPTANSNRPKTGWRTQTTNSRARTSGCAPSTRRSRACLSWSTSARTEACAS